MILLLAPNTYMLLVEDPGRGKKKVLSGVMACMMTWLPSASMADTPGLDPLLIEPLAMRQYIVKPSRSRLSQFAWHRDCDWCCGPDVDRQPYLSVWVALDDMHAGVLIAPPTPGLAPQTAAHPLA